MDRVKNISGFFLLWLMASTYASQNDIRLNVKPNRCITLHQGQECYQKLTFKWAADSKVKACLVKAGVKKPIYCWHSDMKGKYVYKFESVEDGVFYLSDGENNRLTPELKVRVAWVYKNKRKSPAGWRLF